MIKPNLKPVTQAEAEAHADSNRRALACSIRKHEAIAFGNAREDSGLNCALCHRHARTWRDYRHAESCGRCPLAEVTGECGPSNIWGTSYVPEYIGTSPRATLAHLPILNALRKLAGRREYTEDDVWAWWGARWQRFRKESEIRERSAVGVGNSNVTAITIDEIAEYPTTGDGGGS